MKDSYFIMRILGMLRFVGVKLDKDQEDYLRRHLDDLKYDGLSDFNTNGLCLHCGGEIAIRNPTGLCDHLYYPENCDVCKANKK